MPRQHGRTGTGSLSSPGHSARSAHSEGEEDEGNGESEGEGGARESGARVAGAAGAAAGEGEVDAGGQPEALSASHRTGAGEALQGLKERYYN
jgi:hypothetical protein